MRRELYLSAPTTVRNSWVAFAWGPWFLWLLTCLLLATAKGMKTIENIMETIDTMVTVGHFPEFDQRTAIFGWGGSCNH